MKDIFQNLKLEPTIEEPTEACKGIFFKGYVSSYLSSHNSVELRKSLRVLKRRSCKGCKYCGWIWEYIHEDLCNDQSMIDHIEHGKIYHYVLETSRDWETGYEEVDGSYFIEVKE